MEIIQIIPKIRDTRYRCLSFLFLSLSPLILFAQKKTEEQAEQSRNFYVYLSGGLGNYDSWAVDAGAGWRPIPFCSMEAALRYGGISNGGDALGGISQDQKLHWKTDNLSAFAYSVAFTPTLTLYTPNINIDHVGDHLNLSVGYGITLPLTNKAKSYVSYFPRMDGEVPMVDRKIVENQTRDKNIYQHINFCANLEDEKWGLSIGYRISNYDIFGSARAFFIEGEKINLPTRTANNEVFVRISYRF